MNAWTVDTPEDAVPFADNAPGVQHADFARIAWARATWNFDMELAR